MGLYTQLTQEQRYQIYAFMKAGFSITCIFTLHKNPFFFHFLLKFFSILPIKSVGRGLFPLYNNLKNIFEDGFMRHKDDLDGLEKYLTQMKIISRSDSLEWGE